MTHHEARVRITNPKVASLAPTWRRYRGLSVLFDNPGSPLRPGITPLGDPPAEGRDAQRMYDVLEGVVASMDPAALRTHHAFCPLPRHSYHVTVCDGPNEHSLGETPSPDRDAVAAIIMGLPERLRDAGDRLPWLARAPLLEVAAQHAVTFEVADVAVWGHVLAARLAPADDVSRDALDRISAARADLAREIATRLGLTTQQWRPHVSLGYFANRKAARNAVATLPRWRDAVAASHPPAIRFSSASVYGFTDMASFHRLGT